MFISSKQSVTQRIKNTNVYLYTAFFLTVKVINRNPLKTAFPLSQAIFLNLYTVNVSLHPLPMHFRH